MSQLITQQNVRVCDLYPKAAVGLEHLPPDPPCHDARDWSCLSPTQLQHLVQVFARPRPHRGLIPYAVVYRPGIHPECTESKAVGVGLQLYGYLQSVNVGALGTWDSTRDGIRRATWNIRLVSGPLKDAFNQQADALWDMEQFILANVVGHGLEVEAVEQGRERVRSSIYVARRVFQKVRDGKPVVNLAKTGPAGKYHAEWRVPEVPQLGKRLPNGTIESSQPENFRRGDFVQVTVQFDVERQLLPRPAKMKVRLKLNQLILLVPAQQTGDGQVVPSLSLPRQKTAPVDREHEATPIQEAPGFLQPF
ncbi:hypothetical protein K488DRAFT_87708 [Vararia minispora EC-137]|uniref:Uncharacterized protein n=1 Tax=Vararia minispora EC-137 TaxID=1314806 RepID=A0ACB8QFQ0_9AGAM|nr:hypothetical protein K488DRAFT_87708 [Vararia minispora EC-137]